MFKIHNGRNYAKLKCESFHTQTINHCSLCNFATALRINVCVHRKYLYEEITTHKTHRGSEFPVCAHYGYITIWYKIKSATERRYRELAASGIPVGPPFAMCVGHTDAVCVHVCGVRLWNIVVFL